MGDRREMEKRKRWEGVRFEVKAMGYASGGFVRRSRAFVGP
jgi:hypothetical protein